MSQKRSRVGVVVFLALVTLVASTPWTLGLGLVSSDAPPIEPLRVAWGRVLAAHVVEGGVRYDTLVQDADELRRVVATLGGAGPRTIPPRFPTRASRLAYSINAYNALVLYAVVEAWPIDSVRDVHGWIEPDPGFGFFWARHYELDGRWINLYDLEHDVLRAGFEDARIHAALVCASRSCPELSERPYDPRRLDAQLDRAMRAFCEREVVVEEHRIVLSAIFDWYREDFERDARRAGWGETLLDYVEHCAPRADVARARSEGLDVVFAEYDWRLNAAPPG